MKIHGLQKMTLLDFPGKVACTVFLGGCEYRCPFCHNAELLDLSVPAEMDEHDLLLFLEKRRGLLDGVAFTGGEPLLRKDLAPVLKSIRAMGYAVKLDTNGNHPEQLSELLQAGLLDYVAMDVKNSPARYAETVGLPSVDLAPIDASIRLLLDGSIDYEFRTTVVKELHDEESFRAIAQWIKGARRYYLQCFTDRDTVPFEGLHAPGKEDLERYVSLVSPYVALVETRGV